MNGSSKGKGSSRPPTASSVQSSSPSIRQTRSPSPQHRGVAVNELDHRSIVALSQSCTDDLEVKQREKQALTKLLSDLKKKKLAYENKHAKKLKEVDTTIVQTMELEKKLKALLDTIKMMSAEVAGFRAEKEKLENEVDKEKVRLKEACDNYAKESLTVEKLKRSVFIHRKELSAEAKIRDNVQQDLRASRTAQSLMINRLDDMEKRNRALKTCVADAINCT